MPEQRFDWNDLGYTGMAEVREHLVKWRILDIAGWTDTPEKGGTVVGWWAKDAVSAFPPAESPDDAESVVEIDVKWDGCANYVWNADCATHTCDGGKGFAALILRVHETTADLLKRPEAAGRRL